MKRTALVLLLAGVLAGCSDRSSDWDVAPVDPRDPELGLRGTVGLSGSAAVIDQSLDRVILLTVPAGLSVETHPVAVGRNPSVWAASPDRRRLFVLSRGVDTPEQYVAPMLSVIDGGTEPAVCRRFSLDGAYRQLAIDPQGEWVAVHDADAFVENPNELVLARLDPDSDCGTRSEAEREGQVINRTLESGSSDRPVELVFTPELAVAGGARRMLIIRRDHSVQLLDLRNLVDERQPDLWPVDLPGSADGGAGSPAEVAYFVGGVAADGVDYDPWIAVRMAGSSDVVLVRLVEDADRPNRDFKLSTTIESAGGVPSDLEFVMTDAGLRLAVLVPFAERALLVDPTTGASDALELPAAYSQMTRVTADVTEGADPASPDVALLWAQSERTIAFWSLGETGSQLFRSLDVRDTEIPVAAVTAVTHDETGDQRHLRILSGQGADEFRLLNLIERGDNPLDVDVEGGAEFEIEIAPDGGRLWAYPTVHARKVSRVTLTWPDPRRKEVSLERDLSAVHDIARGGGGRAALMIHETVEGGYAVGATVMDGNDPQSTETRYCGGLLLGGLR